MNIIYQMAPVHQGTGDMLASIPVVLVIGFAILRHKFSR
jgi:hypothetical protein